MATLKVVQPGGHFDQLIRQTRAHHAQLSQMGDLKASMLLTTAAIVVPLVLRFVEEPRFRAPALLMIAFALATMFLAAYAVMPKVSGRRPSPDDPAFNLLFFGDFVHLSYEDFAERMERTLNDASIAYEVQVREVYRLGSYLARRKYRYLRLGYTCFLAGVLSSSLLAALLWLAG
jgi:hypothetical protein